MQFVVFVVIGCFAINCYSKPLQHRRHEISTESEKKLNTSYPKEGPNSWCLDYSQNGRTYYNLNHICRQNNQTINSKISAERSEIHSKIFNEFQLTAEDIEIVCVPSDYHEKLSSDETYEFMTADHINIICDNDEYLNLIDELVIFAYQFPSEVQDGIIPKGQMKPKMGREHTRNNLLNNPEAATELLRRYLDHRAVPTMIQVNYNKNWN